MGAVQLQEPAREITIPRVQLTRSLSVTNLAVHAEDTLPYLESGTLYAE